MFFASIVALGACTYLSAHYLDKNFGTSSVKNRQLSSTDSGGAYVYSDIKPIIDRRCVVCHGCYDAPCQLKLSSFEGIDRGATKNQVFDGVRLLAAEPSRLFVDANSTEEWRHKGFYPVLNERNDTIEANLQASVMYRLLALKHNNPLPRAAQLPETFEFGLNRSQQCTSIENIDGFERDYPLWGMPYGLPGLQQQNYQQLVDWIAQGAKSKPQAPLSFKFQSLIAQWEQFFNRPGKKQALVSRYIYEHVYIANLYFSEHQESQFFKLVRSKTPSPEAIDIISSRRPYDDPGAVFYYRLQPVTNTLVAKRHMPYALNEERLSRWKDLFFDRDYPVDELPNYDPKISPNPFIIFKDIPAISRYQFMLDEAEFTISGFIKGPVCRGQIAVNVINDHFWVMFRNPEEEYLSHVEQFIAREKKFLRLPAAEGSETLPLLRWLRFSRFESAYQRAKEEQLNKLTEEQRLLTLDDIWQGEGVNDNAFLTVFRHFDSATVKRGFLGEVPKTAWLVDYPLLERIHYLLVAGFDVYGNVGHQLLTRLYMDFLRMEGERNFLRLLPVNDAEYQLAHWYRDAESEIQFYIDSIAQRGHENSGIDFKTANPKKELFNLLINSTPDALLNTDTINRPDLLAGLAKPLTPLQQLSSKRGAGISYLPEQLILRIIRNQADDEVYTLLSHRAHSNVVTLLNESERLLPEEQVLDVFRGVVGDYPNIFLSVHESKLQDFVNRFLLVDSEETYRLFLDRYGVRRSSESFWQYSDWLHDTFFHEQPISSGYLDYNRLENR